MKGEIQKEQIRKKVEWRDKQDWVAVLCGALFGCLKSVFNLNGHVIQIKISFSSSNQLVSSHVNVIQLRKIIAGADSEAVRATLSLLCLCWLFITYFFSFYRLRRVMTEQIGGVLLLLTVLWGSSDWWRFLFMNWWFWVILSCYRKLWTGFVCL